MRALVLTTQTSHHTYFVQQLGRITSDMHIVCETSSLTAPFDTVHAFEKRRDQFEADCWFAGKEQLLDAYGDTIRSENINDSSVIDHVRALKPDVTVVFGTRKLSNSVIEAAARNVLNLHGGDPEYYRGLDTHLWAIYHGDFANLVTALHLVNDKFDDGAIVGLRAIPLRRGMNLHELRARNTECAVRLCHDAIRELEETDALAARTQRQVGRYYSFMPAVLKAVCVQRFERYCAELT